MFMQLTPVVLISCVLAVQVRLYSLAGHLHSLHSACEEKPVTIQRLPSKLSSLAWDFSQQVCPSPDSLVMSSQP